jgi:hypothetical protein
MPQQTPIAYWIGGYRRAGVMVTAPLRCHPVTGAVLTIPYKFVSPLNRVVKWTRIEDTSPPLPRVDPFSVKLQYEPRLPPTPPPLPSLEPETEPEPQLPKAPEDHDYRAIAAEELAAGRALEYPNIASFGWMQDLPDLPDPTEPEADEVLPMVDIPPSTPPTAAYQHVPHVSPQGDRGRIR